MEKKRLHCVGHRLGEARTHKNSHCSGGNNQTASFQAAHEKATFSQPAVSGNLNGNGEAWSASSHAFLLDRRFKMSPEHQQLQMPWENDFSRACIPSPHSSQSTGSLPTGTQTLGPRPPGCPMQHGLFSSQRQHTVQGEAMV